MNISKATATGFDKVSALNSTSLNVDIKSLKNATTAWKKEGSPLQGKELTAFVNAYITKHKCKGIYLAVSDASKDTRKHPYTVLSNVTVGKTAYTTEYQVKEAVLEIGSRVEQVEILDKETKEPTGEFRDKTVHFTRKMVSYEVAEVDADGKKTGEVIVKEKEIKVPMVKVREVGAVVGEATKKAEAEKLMKKLITDNKRSYVVEKVKVSSDADKNYTSFGVYTPSANAEEGNFMFFVVD